MTSFYTSGQKTVNFFTQTTRSSTEHDVRQKVSEIIKEKGSWVIVRRARRDTSGAPILANATLNNRSSEALVGTNKGMRFLFDDRLVQMYISRGQTFHEFGSVESYGDNRTDVVKHFLEYDCISRFEENNYAMLDEHDKIIVPLYDLEGNLKSPLEIREIHDIASCEPYRLDGAGRVEFFEINLMTQHNSSHRL